MFTEEKYLLSTISGKLIPTTAYQTFLFVANSIKLGRACSSDVEQGQHGIGPTRRRSTCEKDHVRAKMEHKQSKRDRARERRRKQRDIASEESKAKERV